MDGWKLNWLTSRPLLWWPPPTRSFTSTGRRGYRRRWFFPWGLRAGCFPDALGQPADTLHSTEKKTQYGGQKPVSQSRYLATTRQVCAWAIKAIPLYKVYRYALPFCFAVKWNGLFFTGGRGALTFEIDSNRRAPLAALSDRILNKATHLSNKLLLHKSYKAISKPFGKRFADSLGLHARVEKLLLWLQVFASSETSHLKKSFNSLKKMEKNLLSKWNLSSKPRFTSLGSVRMSQKGKVPHNWLRQDPLEAILVILGRRALIFFVWKLLEKNEKWHHFCAHAQWWSPWRRKNVEKGHLAPSNLTFFINCDRHKRFSQNERRRADLQNFASDFIIFAWALSYGLSKLSDIFTPFFRLWITITKSLGKN